MSVPTQGPGQKPSPLAVMKPMIYSYLAAPLVLAVPVWFAVPGMAEPSLWIPILIIVVAIIAYAVAESAGFAVPAIARQASREEAMRTAVAQWRAKLLLRFAVTEAVVLIGLALSFVESTRWPFILGVVVGLPLLAYEILPTRRTIDKLQARLDREGGSSFLDEALRTPG